MWQNQNAHGGKVQREGSTKGTRQDPRALGLILTADHVKKSRANILLAAPVHPAVIKEKKIPCDWHRLKKCTEFFDYKNED